MMGSNGALVMAFVTGIGTHRVKVVWQARLPGCTAYLVDGIPIQPGTPLGTFTGTRPFPVIFVFPMGVPLEHQVNLGELTFVGCFAVPDSGLSCCLKATCTFGLWIWVTLPETDMGSWNLAVRLNGVGWLFPKPMDKVRMEKFVKSEEMTPPVNVSVTLTLKEKWPLSDKLRISFK